MEEYRSIPRQIRESLVSKVQSALVPERAVPKINKSLSDTETLTVLDHSSTGAGSPREPGSAAGLTRAAPPRSASGRVRTLLSPGGLLVLFWLGAWFPHNQAEAIEEPRYTLVSKAESFEIRDYPAYLTAEVTLEGSADDTGNEGFRILFRYITGKNRAQQKIEMTAPVSQQAAGIEIPMTAPVTRQGGDRAYSLQFTMPAGWTLDTLPTPEDSRVRLREMPAARYAVIRFTGLWTDRNYEKHLAELRSAVDQVKLEVVGEPVYSRYDPPFMPFFLRRNEIWLPIRKD